MTTATAPKLSEDDFKDRVIGAAKAHGWRVAHFRPARTARGWVTAMQGHKGFPDLVLARNGQLILAELKSDTGRVDPEQRKWLAALGTYARLWRPDDWPTILFELEHGVQGDAA